MNANKPATLVRHRIVSGVGVIRGRIVSTAVKHALDCVQDGETYIDQPIVGGTVFSVRSDTA